MNKLQKPFEIIVVDDNVEIINLLTESLVKNYSDQINIKSFINPKKALEFIINHEVDIIISDMVMPEIHGEKFLRKCTELRTGVKTITMTGQPQLCTVMSGYIRGDIGYLIKPFSEDELFKFVNIAMVNIINWRLTFLNLNNSL